MAVALLILLGFGPLIARFKSSARSSNALMTQKISPINKGKKFNDLELENIREITKL
jgi:hypothetical protein